MCDLFHFDLILFINQSRIAKLIFYFVKKHKIVSRKQHLEVFCSKNSDRKNSNPTENWVEKNEKIEIYEHVVCLHNTLVTKYKYE